MAGTVYYNEAKVENVIKNRDDLLRRVDIAIMHGFYVEAIVILHSMMENYTYKLMHILKIPYKAGDRFFQCLFYLKKHVDNHSINADLNGMSDEEIAICLEKEFFSEGLFDCIEEWRRKRNIMIHDIAIEEASDDYYHETAIEGKQLFIKYEVVLNRILDHSKVDGQKKA